MKTQCLLSIVLLLYPGWVLSQPVFSNTNASNEATTGTADMTCGAKCLMALHALMGDTSASIPRIALECNVSSVRGILMLDLKRYLDRHGFQNRAVRVVDEDFDARFYYLLPIRKAGGENYDHYVLVIRSEGENCLLFDGTEQVVSMSKADLKSVWSGECLKISKAVSPPAALEMDFVQVSGKDRPFFASRHQITVQQYGKFLESIRKQEYNHEFCWEMNCSRSHLPIQRDSVSQLPDEPQVLITWMDAYAFAKWLGPEYSLPTKSHYLAMTGVNEGLCKEGVVSIEDRRNCRPLSIALDQRRNSKGISGLFSNVQEFTLDSEDHPQLLPYDQILYFAGARDESKASFVMWSPRTVKEDVGFRIVKLW